MIICSHEQGSPQWSSARLGVITASEIDCVLAGTSTAKRATYMAELVAEVATGMSAEINAKQLAWGHEHEHAARSAYEFATGNVIQQVGLIYKDETRRTGCSPDGLIKNVPKGLELKCPYSSKTHVGFVASAKIKPEYIKQCQFGMWVTGLPAWDFASYDPRMRNKMLHYVTIVRDDEMMRLFDSAVPDFISDMDKMLSSLGVEWGSQWMSLEGA